MRTKFVPTLLVLLGGTIQAYPDPIEPLGTFDLDLERRAGPGATIAFFVARGSHLYFVVSTSSTSLAFQTDEYGAIQSIGSLGTETIFGFDVDATGRAFSLDGSRLTEFDSRWNIKRTLSLPAPIVSFALLGRRPMGVGQDRKLRYLDAQEPGFTLEDYPPPWLLFSVGANRLGVLRSEASAVHVVHREDGISTIMFGKEASARKPMAAAAGPGNKIYLLESPDRAGSFSVLECDDYIRPTLMFNFALPRAFEPRMIGIAGGRVYIADTAGKVAFYPLDPSAPAVQAMDSGPELLTDTQRLRESARKAGYTETIVVELEVSEDGRPRNIRIQNSFASVPEVMDAIQAWRFRPAIRSGRAVAVPITVNVN